MLSVCLSVSIIHYVLNKHDNLFENFVRTFGRYYPLVQMHEIVFTRVTVPRRIFWVIFCSFLVVVTFLRSFISWEPFNCFTHYFDILYRYFLYYSDIQCTKKNFTARILLLGELCSIFGPVFGIFLNLLRNLKHSLDILHECFGVTLMVSKQENVLCLLLLLTYWCFWSMFYYFPQIVRNYEAFSSEFLFNFLFRNIK